MRVRRGWPMALLLVLLVTLPTLEVWLLLQVGHRIGIWPTLAILVVEALVGGWLIRREGHRTWQALVSAFRTGRLPTGELADAALVLVGGVLLLLPGFLTDIVGFLFLLPLTRPLPRAAAAFFIARRVNRSGLATGQPPGRVGEVIPGEAVADPAPGPSTDPRVISGEVADR